MIPHHTRAAHTKTKAPPRIWQVRAQVRAWRPCRRFMSSTNIRWAPVSDFRRTRGPRDPAAPYTKQAHILWPTKIKCSNKLRLIEWESCYKLGVLLLYCVLLRTSSSGLRLRQDVPLIAVKCDSFARRACPRAHFYQQLSRSRIPATTSPTYPCQHGQDTTQKRQGSLSAR